MTDDTSDDGKWLTYQQLAEARRISKPSAIRLVMRHRWRRQRDNERVVRVLVPPAMLEPDHAPYDASDDVSGDASHDTSLVAGALAVLEDAVAALREQLDAANATADRAQADRADERLRADRAEAAIGVERQRADALRDRVTAMREQLADAHAALQAAAAAEARTERAEADRADERQRADDLRTQIDVLRAEADRALAAEQRADELQAGQELMMDMHARALAALQGDLEMARAQATTAHDALRAVRQAEQDRKARGLLARLRAAVRRE
jgi:chromosome segregation ATPase